MERGIEAQAFFTAFSSSALFLYSFPPEYTMPDAIAHIASIGFKSGERGDRGLWFRPSSLNHFSEYFEKCIAQLSEKRVRFVRERMGLRCVRIKCIK